MCSHAYQPGYLGSNCYGLAPDLDLCMNHAIKEVTICECGGSWYRGDHFQKKLTWAKKYYCPKCHPIRATQEKVSILKAVPYDVLKILIANDYLAETHVTDIVWK